METVSDYCEMILTLDTSPCLMCKFAERCGADWFAKNKDKSFIRAEREEKRNELSDKT